MRKRGVIISMPADVFERRLPLGASLDSTTYGEVPRFLTLSDSISAPNSALTPTFYQLKRLLTMYNSAFDNALAGIDVVTTMLATLRSSI